MNAPELVSQITRQILVRKGDIVDAALAEERARNIVAALDLDGEDERAAGKIGRCTCGFCEACVTHRVRG